jgi:hypothetical protein
MPFKNPADKMRWQQENRLANPERQKIYWANSRKAQMGEPGSATRKAYNEKENARRKRRNTDIILAELATERRLREEAERQRKARGYDGKLNLEAIR